MADSSNALGIGNVNGGPCRRVLPVGWTSKKWAATATAAATVAGTEAAAET